MDEPWGHHARWNKPDIKGQTLDDSPNMRRVEQSNSERQNAEQWLPGAEGRRGWGLLFTGYRVSVLGDEEILEMDGGDDCTTMWMCLTPLNCVLKNGQQGKLYVRRVYCYICNLFKKQTCHNDAQTLMSHGCDLSSVNFCDIVLQSRGWNYFLVPSKLLNRDLEGVRGLCGHKGLFCTNYNTGDTQVLFTPTWML